VTNKYAFVAIVQIETSDPRLSEESLGRIHDSARNVAIVRAAVLQHLAKDVQRLIAVMPIEEARTLMLLHEAVGDELGVEVASRPPPGYIPPTRD
jgi:hypothetical protein